MATCPDCNGRGHWWDGRRLRTCRRCKGSGVVGFPANVVKVCRQCGGALEMDDDEVLCGRVAHCTVCGLTHMYASQVSVG